MPKTTNDWLKKIFSVGSISLLVSVIGLYIAYKTFMVDTGGELKISFTGQYSDFSSHDGCMVALNEQSAAALNTLLPQFSNPSKYNLKDFYLRYTFTGDNVHVEPTDFFDAVPSRRGAALTLHSERLASGMKAEEPVSDLAVTAAAVRLSVDVDASFNGCEEPYHRSFRYRILWVPLESKTYEAWLAEVRSVAGDNPVLAFVTESSPRLLTSGLTPGAVVKPAVEVTEEAVAVIETEPASTPVPEKAKTSSEIKSKKNTDGGSVFWFIVIMILFLGSLLAGSIGFDNLSDAFSNNGCRLKGLKWEFERELQDDFSNWGTKPAFINLMWFFAWVAVVFLILLSLVMLFSLVVLIASFF